MKPRKIELLSPAGSFQSLRAAIQAGADAVYFGLKEFNMRSSAKNFSLRDINKIDKICKQAKIRKYLTLNTIIYDSEIKKIENILKKIKGKVDAVICWDLSVIQLCKKYKIPFHISTQASVSNLESAKFYKKIGAERIILARELNLAQIKKISKIIPVEVFVHGAMCVSISGRCFISQFIHKKSANRGECTHPCRREYIIKDVQNGFELKMENHRIMSAKDLCTLSFIDNLKKSNISAFKIEGRNRSPDYVYTVTKVYRQALDSKKLSKQQIEKGIEELKKVYNKGFSSGFFLGLPTSDDFSSAEDSLAKEKKHVLGIVEKYWPKIQVAAIKILARSVKLGEEIIIIGKETGIQKIKVESMEINHKPVSIATKGQLIGVKLKSPVKKGDDVFIIEKS